MTVTLWQLKDLMLVKDAILLSQPRPVLGGNLELQVFQSDFPQAPEKNKNLPFIRRNTLSDWAILTRFYGKSILPNIFFFIKWEDSWTRQDLY